MSRLVEFGLVGLGSAIGGMARYGVALLIAYRFPIAAANSTAFPTATFVANVSGCFLLGLLTGVLAIGEAKQTANGASGANAASPEMLRLLLGIGVLGGYTTFSTLMLDSVRLGVARGVCNVLASGVAGVVAVWLGQMLGRTIFRA